MVGEQEVEIVDQGCRITEDVLGFSRRKIHKNSDESRIKKAEPIIDEEYVDMKGASIEEGDGNQDMDEDEDVNAEEDSNEEKDEDEMY